MTNATRNETFDASVVDIAVNFATVTVQQHSGSGIRVEVSGPSHLVSEVILDHRLIGLIIREQDRQKTSGSVSSMVVTGNGNVQTRGLSNSVVNVSYGDRPTSQEECLTIKVLMPSGSYQVALTAKGTANAILESLSSGKIDLTAEGNAQIFCNHSTVTKWTINADGNGRVIVDQRSSAGELCIVAKGLGYVLYDSDAYSARLIADEQGTVVAQNLTGGVTIYDAYSARIST